MSEPVLTIIVSSTRQVQVKYDGKYMSRRELEETLSVKVEGPVIGPVCPECGEVCEVSDRPNLNRIKHHDREGRYGGCDGTGTVLP